MSTRESAVSGTFYPSSSYEIESMFEHFNSIIDQHIKDTTLLNSTPRAIIAPHAGYIYSGFSANIAYRLLKNSNPKTIVVIGPSHRVYLNGVSICDKELYDTPFGTLNIDQTLLHDLEDKFALNFIPEAHHEHSTEVQMPFIKFYLPNSSVIEMVYGKEDPTHLSKIIDYLLKDPDISVVISTDLSHYYDLQKANTLDSICMEAITNLNPQELHQGCEACGKIGVEALLLVAKNLNLKPKLLDYRTSADASGDKSKVVGYVSVAFYE